MRLIDADALKDTMCTKCANGEIIDNECNGSDCSMLREIESAPTIEAEPVRHGRWIDPPIGNTKVAKCSLCGFWQRTNGDDKTGKHLIHNAVYRYCAGCGAKMDAEGGTISDERIRGNIDLGKRDHQHKGG